jgi:hypothetical protein
VFLRISVSELIGRFACERSLKKKPEAIRRRKNILRSVSGNIRSAAKKWTVMDARSINADQDDMLATAHSDLEQDLEHTAFQNEEDKAESLYQTMKRFIAQRTSFCCPRALPQLKAAHRVAQEARWRSLQLTRNAS